VAWTAYRESNFRSVSVDLHGTYDDGCRLSLLLAIRHQIDHDDYVKIKANMHRVYPHISSALEAAQSPLL
jgi:hypothetical protein